MRAMTQSYGLSLYISFPAALPLLRARARSLSDGIERESRELSFYYEKRKFKLFFIKKEKKLRVPKRNPDH